MSGWLRSRRAKRAGRRSGVGVVACCCPPSLGATCAMLVRVNKLAARISSRGSFLSRISPLSPPPSRRTCAVHVRKNAGGANRLRRRRRQKSAIFPALVAFFAAPARDNMWHSSGGGDRTGSPHREKRGPFSRNISRFSPREPVGWFFLLGAAGCNFMTKVSNWPRAAPHRAHNASPAPEGSAIYPTKPHDRASRPSRYYNIYTCPRLLRKVSQPRCAVGRPGFPKLKSQRDGPMPAQADGLVVPHKSVR